MKITFLGAAKQVTGSNYLIETKTDKFIIDCGMFQGGQTEEAMNFEPFRFQPSELSFMILTHAHIDHSGRIPKLVKDGFQGKIYATKATCDLSEIMLKDSAKIQAMDVEWENKHRLRSGRPLIQPLYSLREAELSLSHFSPVFYEQKIKINDNISFCFQDAGHILGSSIVEIWIKEDEKIAKLVFSGDLGMPNQPLIRDPQMINEADFIILESTYGNMIHEGHEESLSRLMRIIDEVYVKGGTIVIPSFAVGRTQELIFNLNKVYETDQPKPQHQRIPIYIDSPMAVLATEAFMENSDIFDQEAQELILKGDNIFEFPNLKYVRTLDESIMLNEVQFPKLVISSSGMADAGRVRHHLKNTLWNKKNAIVFIGFQAEGTLGRMLIEGVEKVKLFGEEVVVKAKIYSLGGFSAHADEPMLLEWISNFKTKPSKVFLVHGEEKQINPLATVIRDKIGFPVIVPSLGESFPLVADGRIFEKEVIHDEMIVRLNMELADIIRDIKQLETRVDLTKYQGMEEEKYSKLQETIKQLRSDLMNLNMHLGK